MDETSQRIRRARLAAMMVVGVVAVVAGLIALMLSWKAPAASAQTTEDPDDDKNVNFVVRCDFSHRKSDDPIVRPGQPGASHSHDFFGNTTTDASSTYESLQAAPTTCDKLADTAAYWMPTLKWNKKTITSHKALFYYRAGGKDRTQVQPHPAGLKVVAGPYASPNPNISWRCMRGEWMDTPPISCSNGVLVVRVIFPDCSDGRIDSADHRSHMAYAEQQSDGTMQCPSTHPIPVPGINMQISFKIGSSKGTVVLSSGDYTSMHADFWNAWDQEALAALVKLCINERDPLLPKPEECKVQGGSGTTATATYTGAATATESPTATAEPRGRGATVGQYKPQEEGEDSESY